MDGGDRIEKLVARLDQIPDAGSRELAHELIAAILALHRAGWQRVLEFAQQAGEPGHALLRRVADDDLTGGLLALYELHPDSMESRVEQTLRTFDAAVQTTDITEGNVRVSLRSGGTGLKRRLEAAIREACPDAASVKVEAPERVAGFVPLASLTAK